MDKWHKRFLIFQIAVLLLMSIIRFSFPGDSKLVLLLGMTTFFFAEFGVLERQRRYSKEAVFYKKSCLLAIIDLISGIIFFYEFLQIFFDYLCGNNYLKSHYPFLLVYIAIRKFYILKNYSYEN
jgi:hypothetical protein